VWIPAAVTAVLLLTHLQSWELPAELLSLVLLACTAASLFRRLPHSEAIQVIAVLIALILAAAAISVWFYDSSDDGRNYHADAILGLLRGVNPIYGQFRGAEPVWSNHYPKATWYFAAVVIHLFHNYQLGKIYNFLLIFAAMAFAVRFFRWQGLGEPVSVLLGAIAAFSPVALSQINTFYVDGAIGSLMILILLSGVNIVFRAERLDRVVFVLAASLAIAVKFTAGPYIAGVALVMVAVRLWLRWRKLTPWIAPQLRADLVSLLAVGFLGVVILGYAPYVTNTLQGLGPLYPVAGPKKIDIMTRTYPVEFLDHSYSLPRKFLISFFARTQSRADQPTSFKVPLTFSKKEILSLGTPDSRMAGWGVFFSGATLISVAVFFLAKGWRDTPIVVALLFVIVTTFMNPECWWARFTPQFALLPILLLVPALQLAPRLTRLAARVMVLFLALNGLVSAGAAAAAAFIKTRMLDKSLTYIAETGGPGEYWAYREPGDLEHYDQFSGIKGVVICDEIVPPRYPLPDGGFPLSQNMNNEPQVILYKGSCSAGPPL